MALPLDLDLERALPPEWQGDVVICDVDRTYLATRFSSFRGLARIPFELAVDKRDLPGMAALLAELRRGPGPKSRLTPLVFVSASPVLLRPVLQRKMLLDGIEYDGTLFKDWSRVLGSLRPWRLRDQLGFKVSALLALAASLPPGSRLVLIGDDLEADPRAFVLVAGALAGEAGPEELDRRLRAGGVDRADAADLAGRLPEVVGRALVRRILIRRERSADGAALRALSPLLAPAAGALPMAAVAAADGLISTAGFLAVAAALHRRGQSPGELEGALGEATGLLPAAALAGLRAALAGAGPERAGREDVR